MNNKDKKVYNLVRLSAIIIVLGALLSGPVGTGLVLIIKPQPKWQGIETYILNYHWIQTVPFVLGFLLMLGSCLFVASASALAKDEVDKVMAKLSLMCITVYSSLIVINYTIQIAYIPAAIDSNKEFIPMLSMSNPSSLCWAIEMFGYMFQGIAFWLVYPVFMSNRRFKFTKLFLLTNLLMSMGGAVLASTDVSWAMKPFGLVMFIAWNLVLVALMWVIAVDCKEKAVDYKLIT